MISGNPRKKTFTENMAQFNQLKDDETKWLKKYNDV